MAEEEDESSKTEDPTPKKLEESRKKGQVAVSREVNNWLMLCAGTVLVMFVGPDVMSDLKNHMKIYIEHAGQLPQIPGGLYSLLGDSFFKILSILALPLLMLMFVAFMGPFLQTGVLFAPEVLKPDISKISPLKGFKRLFSARSLMEFVKGILKIGIISVVGYLIVSPFFGAIDGVVGVPTAKMLEILRSLFGKMMTGVLVVLIVIAVIDLVYQRMEHYKKMRMTKQEVKDEYKQAEGDPHVKAKLRQLRRERAGARMMQAVPEADVVITNPTHFAVALKYTPKEMNAPVCVAKGQDLIAFRIREIAKEHNIEIYENPPLARSLYDLVEVEQEIPNELYKAVAEVISYVFRKQGKL